MPACNYYTYMSNLLGNTNVVNFVFTYVSRLGRCNSTTLFRVYTQYNAIKLPKECYLLTTAITILSHEGKKMYTSIVLEEYEVVAAKVVVVLSITNIHVYVDRQQRTYANSLTMNQNPSLF